MKYKKYTVTGLFLILFPLIVFLIHAEADDIIKKGELVTLERSIGIALKRHPKIIASRNTTNAIQSRVKGAQSNYYPQVDWSGAYSRIDTASPVSGDAFDQYTTGITLKQNIYDFGKTATQVRIQDLNLDSSYSDLDNTVVQTIFNIKQAYYGVLKAKRIRDVEKETVSQFEHHLEQAKGFYEVGTKPKFDVTKAEVDLSNAKLSLIKAENAVRIATAALNNAMGVPDAPEYIIEDNLSFQKYEVAFEGALSLAFQNRPDLSAIIAQKTASEESVELAKKGFYPVLTGNAAYNWTGTGFPLNEGWNVGATIAFPLFSGFLTKHQVDEARATLKVAQANEEALRQTIIFEVQQAYLNLNEAVERIPVAELGINQAEENLELANGRYAAGVGSPIEVTDAQVGLSNARSSYIQALYDYKVAVASLEKAVGIR